MIESLRSALKRCRWLYAPLRWLKREAPRLLAKPVEELLRAILPASSVVGPPKGLYSVHRLLQQQPAGIEGRIVLADQGAPPVPEPSLMVLSGLRQHLEQPWPVLWSRHRPARLVGPGLAHVDAFKHLCAEAAYGERRARSDPAYRYLALRRPRPLAGRWTSVVSKWIPVDHVSSYAHWLLEALPRLAVLAEFPADTGIIVPPHRLRYQVESLRLLGLEWRCRWTSEQHLLVEDYYFSAPPSMIVCYSPYAVDYLRSQFAGYADTSAPTPPRFYIHRGQRTRGVANEQAVLEFFEKRGWHIVDTATLTLTQQIALFANAEAICGPHGAGFANAVWCRAGCRLIELCAERYLSGCFEWLSYCVKAEHHFRVFPSDANLNAQVDLACLEQLLRSLRL